MKFIKYALLAVLMIVAAAWICPQSAEAAVPTFTTSGAHSVPIFHFAWLAGIFSGLCAGAIATRDELFEMAARIPPGIERKEAPDLELQLKGIQTEIVSKIADLKRTTGAETAELKTQVLALQKQADALDVAISERHVGGGGPFGGKTLEAVVKENDGIERLMRDKKGACVLTIPNAMLERKTAVTAAAAGFQTTGVLQIDRIPGITTEGRQELLIRDALAQRPTVLGYCDFIKVSSPLVVASPQQGEGHTKLENAVTFTSASEKVKTIATTIPASRQILDDWGELLGFLQTGLAYYVDLAEEQQLLTGNGLGENLNGLVTQATAFDTTLLPAAGTYNRIDIIGRAIEQIMIAKELKPTFIVMNPADWWSIRLTKDSFGRYILGDPMGPVTQEQLFGLTPIVTTSITSGTFLLGSGRPEASEIRLRLDTVVELATQHGTQFTENMVTLRAERREALVVKRAGSYIFGSLTSSPA